MDVLHATWQFAPIWQTGFTCKTKGACMLDSQLLFCLQAVFLLAYSIQSQIFFWVCCLCLLTPSCCLCCSFVRWSFWLGNCLATCDHQMAWLVVCLSRNLFTCASFAILWFAVARSALLIYITYFVCQLTCFVYTAVIKHMCWCIT